MADALEAARGFDPSTELTTSASVGGFAVASIGWLAGLRQSATVAADYQQTVLDRATDALSHATGVSIDEEYAKQLQLEQSYTASSKLIGIVDQMFDVLFVAVS